MLCIKESTYPSSSTKRRASRHDSYIPLKPNISRRAILLLLQPPLNTSQNGLRSYIDRTGQYRSHKVSFYSSDYLPSKADVRYWGKRDTKLILPTNSSLSVTLDQDHLRSTTTSRADESFEKGDKLWLNGKDDPIKEGGRLWVCIKELRAWRKEMEEKDSALPKVCYLWEVLENR